MTGAQAESQTPSGNELGRELVQENIKRVESQ